MAGDNYGHKTQCFLQRGIERTIKKEIRYLYSLPRNR